MTLAENINQVIADFDSIKTAIENKGVDVPDGTPTSEYNKLISNIQSGGEDGRNYLVKNAAQVGDVEINTYGSSSYIGTRTTLINRAATSYGTAIKSTTPIDVTNLKKIVARAVITATGSNEGYECALMDAELSSANYRTNVVGGIEANLIQDNRGKPPVLASSHYACMKEFEFDVSELTGEVWFALVGIRNISVGLVDLWTEE